MLSDRTRSPSPYNPDDTWDNFESKDFTKSVYSSGGNMYDDQNATSEDSILKAFTQSDAIKDIMRKSSTYEPNANSRKIELQNKSAFNDKINKNILPYSVREENMLDDVFLGSNLNVENQFKSASMVDRLGNTFDIWESEFPPAEKDHSTTANSSSDRRLERLQGYDINKTQKKVEVKGTVNPAEPVSSKQQAKVRGNNMEYNSREAFFNKNGLQPIQELDENRDMYDGYNWKTGHETRTFPLENSWRHKLFRKQPMRKASNLPEQSTKDGLVTKRKELSKVYAVKKANPVGNNVSGKSAKITIPIVSAATMRSEKTYIHAKAAHIDQGFSQLSNSDSSSLQQGRLEKEIEVKNTDQIGDCPVPMADVQHSDSMRENGTVKPTATRDWNMIQQISQGIDHLTEDDHELQEIMDNSSLKGNVKAPDQAQDHITDKEMKQRDPSKFKSLTDANKVSSEVIISQGDDTMVNNERQDVHTLSNMKPDKIMLSDSDVVSVDDTRASQTINASKLLGKNYLKTEKKYITRNQQQVSNVPLPKMNAKQHIPVHDRATYTVERPKHGIVQAISYALGINKLEDTNRNNVNNEKQLKNGVNGDRVYATQQNNKFAESDTFYKNEVPETHIPSQTMEGTRRTTENDEHDTYLRINSQESSTFSGDIHPERIENLSKGGTIDTDRIHAPHTQDWRKNDMHIQQTTKLSEDRSVPSRPSSRAPSQNSNARMTPSLQNSHNSSLREVSSDCRTMTPSIDKNAYFHTSSRD